MLQSWPPRLLFLRESQGGVTPNTNYHPASSSIPKTTASDCTWGWWRDVYSIVNRVLLESLKSAHHSPAEDARLQMIAIKHRNLAQTHRHQHFREGVGGRKFTTDQPTVEYWETPTHPLRFQASGHPVLWLPTLALSKTVTTIYERASSKVRPLLNSFGRVGGAR